MKCARQHPLPLRIAVLAACDTRTCEKDASGQALADRLTGAGRPLGARELAPDDPRRT